MFIDSVEIDGSKNVNRHRSHGTQDAAEKEWIRAEARKLKYHVSEEEESGKQQLSTNDDVCGPARDNDKSKIIHSTNGIVRAGYLINYINNSLIIQKDNNNNDSNHQCYIKEKRVLKKIIY